MVSSTLILFKEIFLRFWHDKCMRSAQALTYNTVFALIPLLAFALSVVRFFVGTEEISSRINDALSQFLNPGALSKAQQTILNLVEEAQKAPLGAASMILFLTMVVGLLMQFEEVLNEIFRIKQGRAFVQKITVYWMGLTLGPILIALPLGVTIYLAHLGLKGMGIVPFLLKFWTIPTVVLLFTCIYIYLPATQVKLMPAAIGATISAILWVIVASLYAIYTSKAVAYSKLYGSLSTIPLFLLWLWVNWMVVLLGAEIVSVLQQKEKIIAHHKLKDDISHTLLAIGTVLTIYHNHHEGLKGPDILRLSHSLKTSPLNLEKLIEALINKEIVYTHEDRLFLAKDAETISIKDIIQTLDGKLPEKEPDIDFLKPPYYLLKKNLENWEKITIKSLYHKITRKDEKDGPLPEM